MPAAIAAGVAGVAGVAGSLISASATRDAASQAAAEQDKALANQQATTAAITARLQPFVDAGTNDTDPFSNFYKTTADQAGNAWNLAQDNIPGSMTQAQLEATPGYQFSLSQGLRSVQNAAAAKGLGVSGAALQGAATYATGLANQTYKDQFGLQQQRFNDFSGQAASKTNQLNTIYNQLQGPVSIGENAGAAVGNNAQAGANNFSAGATNLGNALAAGTSGAGNQLAGGLQSLGNIPQNFIQAQNSNDLQAALLKQAGGGGGGVNVDMTTPISG